MTLSVLLYALMVSTFVALVGVLVVDAVRGLSRSRRSEPDPHPQRGVHLSPSRRPRVPLVDLHPRRR